MVTRLRRRGRSSLDAFAALADPTRRAIVELLWAGEELTAGAIAERFPRLTRTAVSKHLRVLRTAGVAVARAEGRTRRYALDTRSLGAIDAWCERYRASWQRRLAVVA